MDKQDGHLQVPDFVQGFETLMEQAFRNKTAVADVVDHVAHGSEGGLHDEPGSSGLVLGEFDRDRSPNGMSKNDDGLGWNMAGLR